MLPHRPLCDCLSHHGLITIPQIFRFVNPFFEFFYFFLIFLKNGLFRAFFAPFKPFLFHFKQFFYDFYKNSGMKITFLFQSFLSSVLPVFHHSSLIYILFATIIPLLRHRKAYFPCVFSQQRLPRRKLYRLLQLSEPF